MNASKTFDEFCCVFCGKDIRGHPLSDVCYTCNARACVQCTLNGKRIKHYKFGGNHSEDGQKMYCEFCEDKISEPFKDLLKSWDTDITDMMSRIDSLNKMIYSKRKSLIEIVNAKKNNKI